MPIPMTDMERLLLILTVLFLPPAWAQEATPAAAPITPQERKELLDRAQSLKSEAGRIKAEAEKQRKEADASCWKKTLVSACLEDARRASIDSNAEARRKETEARRLEREVRQRDTDLLVLGWEGRRSQDGTELHHWNGSRTFQ